MKRFLIAAIPAFGVILGAFAATSVSITLSLIGSIICIASAVGLVNLATARQKIRTKRKTMKFLIDVMGKTYGVEFFVSIKGTQAIREQLTSGYYWKSVIHIKNDVSQTVEDVQAEVKGHITAAVNTYNLSTSPGISKKLSVIDIKVNIL